MFIIYTIILTTINYLILIIETVIMTLKKKWKYLALKQQLLVIIFKSV